MVRDVWNLFTGRFISLWQTEAAEGSLCPPPLFADDAAATVALQTAYMQARLTSPFPFQFLCVTTETRHHERLV